jgi:hypothetical protein
VIELTVSPEMADYLRKRAAAGTVATWPDGTGAVVVTMSNAEAQRAANRLSSQATVIRELLQAPV